MRVTTFSALMVLMIGVSGCNNPKPADPAVEATAPANDVMPVPTPAPDASMTNTTMPESSNAVASSGATNTTTDDPRGNPDRRSDGSATEPK